MSGVALWAGLAAGLAAALAVPPRVAGRAAPGVAAGAGAGLSPPGAARPEVDAEGLATWVRSTAAVGLGAVVWLLLGGAAGGVAGAVTGTWAYRVSAGVGTARSRARAGEAAADLPALVALFAAGLRAGAPSASALERACAALPGAAADRLAPVRARLHLGVAPQTVWADLASDEVLAPLGRALARAHRTGAPVASVVDDLAAELASRARAGVEDRARAVGVRAALPLGLCLLPGFLLLGIVPVVASLVDGLVW